MHTADFPHAMLNQTNVKLVLSEIIVHRNLPFQYQLILLLSVGKHVKITYFACKVKLLAVFLRLLRLARAVS